MANADVIKRIGDFSIAVEETSLQGWKLVVIGGPVDRTLSVGFESREAAREAALGLKARDIR